jgi:hypothetical protein
VADQALRADIEAAKAQMPSHLGSGREIKKLVEHLWEGETVERMVGGTYGKGNGPFSACLRSSHVDGVAA